MKKIMHITTASEWEEAKKSEIYTALSLRTAGFIHCSLVNQIESVANHIFKGQNGLVLLEIDEDKLKSEVKYEDLFNEGQNYPHIYGPLNIDAVLRVLPFPPENDGNFKLPKEL